MGGAERWKGDQTLIRALGPPARRELRFSPSGIECRLLQAGQVPAAPELPRPIVTPCSFQGWRHWGPVSDLFKQGAEPGFWPMLPSPCCFHITMHLLNLGPLGRPWDFPGKSTGVGCHCHWATSLSLSTFMHWRGKWQPTPVFLPGESHGQRSLAGYSPWGWKSRTWLNAIFLSFL